MFIAAVTTRVELTLSAAGTFALFVILLPAFAANSVMVLATSGRPGSGDPMAAGIAYAVAPEAVRSPSASSTDSLT